MRVEGALGTPVEDRIAVAEHSGRSEEMITPARLPGRDLAAAEIVPLSLRLRQNEAHLLDLWAAVDNDQELRPVNREAAPIDGSLGPGDPLLLDFGPVDDHLRHFRGESITQLRGLGRNVDRDGGWHRVADRRRCGPGLRP